MMDQTFEGSDSGDVAQPGPDSCNEARPDPPDIPGDRASDVLESQDVTVNRDSLNDAPLGMPARRPTSPISVSRPANTAGPKAQNLQTASSVSSRAERARVGGPGRIDAADQEVDSLYFAAVDIALDCWIPDSFG
jgi:hypothetical protein